jgi:ribosomal protein S18 acetylase RimI-like enzyme
MPSFVAANSGSAIDTNQALASRFGIKVSAYKAIRTYNPSEEDFAVLLRDFDAFCETNKNSTCDMLMLTGYHGEYGVAGIFNNLSRNQLSSLVQAAQKHKVVFKHIVADCCCAVFGLKQLEGMLANGGEAIGDRMTSTAHKMHDKLIKKLREADTNTPSTEQSLINTVISESMLTFNAPIYIAKNNDTITTTGTTKTEVRQKLIKVYKDTGMIDNTLSDVDAEQRLRTMGLGEDLNLIATDFQSSSSLYAISEKEDRTELLTLRQQHIAPKEELNLVPMKESDIDALHVLDQRVFPDETPLGKDRLLNVCKKDMSFVIKSSKTNEAVAYVFVNPVGDKLWIDNIGVSPDYARKGLGGRLLDEVIKLADKNNQVIELQVRSNNAGAIALYNKVGFTTTSQNDPWVQMARTPQLALQSTAAQEQARVEAQRVAEQAQARVEAQRVAAQEQARVEAQRVAAQEQARVEAQRVAAQEQARVEAQRVAAQEQARVEAQRVAAQEQARVEQLNLVPMKESDIDALHVLDLRVFPDEEPLGKNRLLNVCRKEMSFVIKSSRTNEAVAYVFVNPTGNKLWIDNIGVSPDYARKGLGSRLLNEVTKLADKNNQVIELQVRSNNTAAIDLYKKVGFQITSPSSSWIQMARTPQLALQSTAEQEQARVEAQRAAEQEKMQAATQIIAENIERQLMLILAAQEKALVEAKVTAAIKLSIEEIQTSINIFESIIVSIKEPIPTAHKLLKTLQTVFDIYKLEMSKGTTSKKDVALAFQKSCQEALISIKKEGLTQKSVCGDIINNVLTGIINALNHVISSFGKLWKGDSSYTFFECKNYTSPKLREALKVVSTITELIPEKSKLDMLNEETQTESNIICV